MKDIIAIKFHCCHKYYPCYQCHQECEEHSITVWKKEQFEERAILCGVCGYVHTIQEYIETSHCLHCQSAFNEGCKYHHHLYFETLPR
ncbi:putative CHY-type Zn-finger protein [Geomicrobium halophilum]|uniref:Putative CHY-type Zn-finger protein n=1 Tax=Geomicrobium halophilum TaxID=549000 RepID=A0A841PZZ7_9BACL|nr:CHY zinc finger protein [Geomicrobium halophilum]MBB6450753.1 putative CHY-type Zn-finger protein [Geomicrobium halophilum]